jgi:hypothetical protein
MPCPRGVLDVPVVVIVIVVVCCAAVVVGVRCVVVTVIVVELVLKSLVSNNEMKYEKNLGRFSYFPRRTLPSPFPAPFSCCYRHSCWCWAIVSLLLVLRLGGYRHKTSRT